MNKMLQKRKLRLEKWNFIKNKEIWLSCKGGMKKENNNGKRIKK